MTNDLLDGIRRNEHRKICMTKLTNLTNLFGTLSTWSSLSCNFFIHSITYLLYKALLLPLVVPACCRTRRDSL